MHSAPDNQAKIRSFWPSPQDYCEAVQTPLISFTEPELLAGQVQRSPLGLPVCMSGNFASVFCFTSGNRKIAVRCFLHDIADQERRYEAISDFIDRDSLESTVPFKYIKEGIKVHGEWFPILKMDWVNGITLSAFVANNARNGTALNLLAGIFKELTLDLERNGIAHGDLQHDNILVTEDTLRLVDYDGMFVPQLRGMEACEIGHPSYQHPARQLRHFGAYLDRFSSWVIYFSLKMISKDPSLFERFGSTDCLLFHQADLLEPAKSELIDTLLKHHDPTIRTSAQALATFLNMPLEDIPNLSMSLPDLHLTPVASAPKETHSRWYEENTTIEVRTVEELIEVETTAAHETANQGRSNIGRGLPDWIDAGPQSKTLQQRAREMPTVNHEIVVGSPATKAEPLNLIQIPNEIACMTGIECKDIIEQQLMPNERICFISCEQLAQPTLSVRAAIFWIGWTLVFLLVGATGQLGKQMPPLDSSISALVIWIFIFSKIWWRGFRSYVSALTNKRLIYSEVRRGDKGAMAISIPISDISHFVAPPQPLRAKKLVKLEVVAKGLFKLSGHPTKNLKLRGVGADVEKFKQCWLALTNAMTQTPISTTAAVSMQQQVSQSPSSAVRKSQTRITAGHPQQTPATQPKLATGGQTINVSSPQIAMPPSVSYTDLNAALVAPPPLEEDEQQP